MNYLKLEENIIEIVKEQQLKLGYRSEVVRLYYPLSSLNRFLGTDCDAAEMLVNLENFGDAVSDSLGDVKVSREGDRFCFLIPETGSAYVHEHMEDKCFLKDFIDVVSKHGCKIEDVLEQFRKYSDCVHIEKKAHGEFDYLVYFEDGKPDDFRYCITDEGCHIIYHRFTTEDYEDFGFDE